MFFDPLDGSSFLLQPARLLRKVKVKDGNSPQPHVCLGQRIDHHHDVDRSSALPVAGQRVEQVVGDDASTPLGRRQPAGHAPPDVPQMSLQPEVERPRYDVDERLSVREQLAPVEGGDRFRVEEVEFEVKVVRPTECCLGVRRNVTPDEGVGNVDRSEEERRTPSTVHSPKKGIRSR